MNILKCIIITSSIISLSCLAYSGKKASDSYKELISSNSHVMLLEPGSSLNRENGVSFQIPENLILASGHITSYGISITESLKKIPTFSQLRGSEKLHCKDDCKESILVYIQLCCQEVPGQSHGYIDAIAKRRLQSAIDAVRFNPDNIQVQDITASGFDRSLRSITRLVIPADDGTKVVTFRTDSIYVNSEKSVLIECEENRMMRFPSCVFQFSLMCDPRIIVKASGIALDEFDNASIIQSIVDRWITSMVDESLCRQIRL